ncbi:hypothetical protein Dsin_022707 [Dipteronia sinensis]|uniref:F-box domain-containing protein n=1 Tax=Dipteronia sinensis TaxID=43782 RepID=A0AAE0A2V9_9ROSI|nr:hypothetical protein Dsin_022707 [Dipteronia sinensis]
MAFSTYKKRKVRSGRKQKSLMRMAYSTKKKRKLWEDLNLDKVEEIFNGLSISDSSQNVSKTLVRLNGMAYSNNRKRKVDREAVQESSMGGAMACSTNKKIKIGSERERESKSQSLELRRWEDLSLDILLIILNSVAVSDLSENTSSVCQSWQLGCWHFLCWKNNELDLSIIKAPLEDVKSPDHLSGGKCNSTETNARTAIRLMELLKNILEDNHGYGIYLEHWRSSIKKLSIPEDIEIWDKHLVYLAERTTGLEELILLGSSRITATGFAKAIRKWKNIKSIRLGKVKIEYFTQIVQVIGKNCPPLEELSLSMHGIHLRKDNACMMVEQQLRVKILRFEGAFIHRDGINIIFHNFYDVKEIQLCKCFLMNDEPSDTVDTTDTADSLHSIRHSIVLTLHRWRWIIKSSEVVDKLIWNQWRKIHPVGRNRETNDYRIRYSL